MGLVWLDHHELAGRAPRKLQDCLIAPGFDNDYWTTRLSHLKRRSSPEGAGVHTALENNPLLTSVECVQRIVFIL